MDAKQIKQLKPMLNKYLRQFDDCFGRIEPTEMEIGKETGFFRTFSETQVYKGWVSMR